MKSKLLILFLFIIMALSLRAEARVPNKLLSFAKSAIIPGWGELSQGHNSAYIFFASELSLIFSYKYNDVKADNKINESLLYAYNKAHVSCKLNDEDLRLIVGRFNSSGYNSGGYNESIVNQAISLFPNDTEAQSNYINNNVLPDNIYWAWDTVADQNKYRIMRKHSNEYKDVTKALTGAIIANHIASAFNAARVTKNTGQFSISLNSELKPLLNYQIEF